LDKDGCDGSGKRSGFDYNLKMELTGFPEKLDMELEKKGRMTPNL
jgi:hypothetical protein